MRSIVAALLVVLACAGPMTAQEPKAKTVEEIAALLKPSVCVITSRGRANWDCGSPRWCILGRMSRRQPAWATAA